MVELLLWHLEEPIVTITFNRPDRTGSGPVWKNVRCRCTVTEHREGETPWNSVYACRIMASQ
jgi:hypothetical protein